jgi:hypothetical protein
MLLKDLIQWLELQDASAVVRDGFGAPHSDRGDYSDVGFEPAARTTFGEMLRHARSALGRTFLHCGHPDGRVSGAVTEDPRDTERDWYHRACGHWEAGGCMSCR